MNCRYLALAAFSPDARDAWPLTLFLLQAFKNIMS